MQWYVRRTHRKSQCFDKYAALYGMFMAWATTKIITDVTVMNDYRFTSQQDKINLERVVTRSMESRDADDRY